MKKDPFARAAVEMTSAVSSRYRLPPFRIFTVRKEIETFQHLATFPQDLHFSRESGCDKKGQPRYTMAVFSVSDKVRGCLGFSFISHVKYTTKLQH